jgi:hypothetical protein
MLPVKEYKGAAKIPDIINMQNKNKMLEMAE